MVDEHDFAIEGEQPVANERAAAQQPAPRVVIEYRSRGVPGAILPPLLVLMAALAIQSYRRETPIRRLPPPVVALAEIPAPGPPPATPQPTPSATEAAPAQAHEAPQADAGKDEEPDDAAGAPIASGSAIDGKSETPTVAKAAPPSEDDPNDPADALPKRPEHPPAPAPPALASNLTADPAPPEKEPEITREQVLAEIEREARLKDAEIRRLEQLGPQLRYFQIAEMFRKAQANRAPFHEALRQALRSRRPNVGKTIDALCDEYGRTTSQEIQAHVKRLLKTSYARLSLRSKVESMRLWGLPEPMILDYLAHDVDKLVGTRGGPRSEGEVRVWAARVLLSIPPKPAASTPSPFADAQPPAARGPR